MFLVSSLFLSRKVRFHELPGTTLLSPQADPSRLLNPDYSKLSSTRISPVPLSSGSRALPIRVPGR
jgi:hypothetical protein